MGASRGRGVARGSAALVLALLVCCAASLTGCGASLNGEFTSLDAAKEQQAAAGLSVQNASSAKPVARAADKLTSAATPGNSGYKIGPLDVLEFSVFKVPELTRTAQVAETGTINLPLVGEVQAVGRTAQEIERDLAKRLGARYLQSPQVTILIKEYNSQRVTVEGAVKTPGVFPIRGKTTLIQVIAGCGGLDSAVSDNTIVVFRQVNGKRMAARFDLGEVRSGQVTDPQMQSGDVVLVPTSSMKESFNAVLKALPLAAVFALM